MKRAENLEMYSFSSKISMVFLTSCITEYPLEFEGVYCLISGQTLPEGNPDQATACADAVLRMACPSGEVIAVKEVRYGTKLTTTCQQGNTSDACCQYDAGDCFDPPYSNTAEIAACSGYNVCNKEKLTVMLSELVKRTPAAVVLTILVLPTIWSWTITAFQVSLDPADSQQWTLKYIIIFILIYSYAFPSRNMIQASTLVTWHQINGIDLSYYIQSTLPISRLKGPSETLRDILTSTYQIFRIEENINGTTKFHKWIFN